MGSPDRVPELFPDPTDVTLRPDECLRPVSIRITPEGIYSGNGQFQDPEGKTFRIVGFDRSREGAEESWIGRGWIITER